MQSKHDARQAGAIAAILTLAVILYCLFASPSLGAVADGSYLTTMEQLSLDFAKETDAVGQRVEQFSYREADMAMLLKAGQPAIAWPYAVVRLCTKPFGLLFDTRLLAVMYALLISAGAALMVSGLRRHSRMAAFLTGVFLPVLMTHSAITAYLNSLYGIGSAITFFVLFTGELVHTLCLPKGRGARPLLAILFFGALLLTSMPQMLVFLPYVLAGAVFAFVHLMPQGKQKLLHITAALFALWIASCSVFDCVRSNADLYSDAADYLAVFQGYMTAAKEPSDVLDALGVPEKYAQDAGKSYYEAEENFAASPHSAEAQKELFPKIGLQARMLYCAKNPYIVLDYISERPVYLQDVYNGYLINAEGNTRYARLSPYSVLETIFGQGGFYNHIIKTAFALLAALLLLLTTKRRGGLRKLCICFALLFLCSALYLPVAVALTGGVDLSLVKVMMIWLGWLGVFFTLGGAALAVQKIFIWLGDKNASLAFAELPAACSADDILAWEGRIHFTRKQLVWTCALVSTIIIGALLLPANHVGGVNNGDFGRMMEQLDLYWTKAQMDDQATQTGQLVIEDYTYREPFHPERLTSLDPTYSLLFPSMLVRLWSLVTGSVFSTKLLAIILLMLTVAGVLLLVYDLYPLLGRATGILCAGLVIMLLGENYVAWYNSLFGESSISTGLVWTAACAVHLSVMQRGSKKSILWLGLLAVSVRFLSCAKAQMALALPAGLILLIALGVYHHPKGALRLGAYIMALVIFCGITTWDTLGVYHKNQGVSEKQTIWQSVFYGALMVTDDPDAAMEELGIDPVMKADIGKHAYYAEEDYVYAPTSVEAEAAFYDHVNTMTMVRYYILHPLDLLKMLNRAAEQSVELHTGFMAYTNETYTENNTLVRFNLWRSIRPLFACRAFWQYVLLYGAALVYCVHQMAKKGARPEFRLLSLLFLCVMMIGVLQFPLSVVGNGYADNNKQLYAFMLCHDVMLLSAVSVGAKKLLRCVRADIKGGKA